ncbi:MAG: class I SAM-dependent rRNA methyltransferase [Planktotalea sp.]|jgi:23S rRNA (cytosine1962-C5)-methyltransferase|uniref:RSP_2647 family RNA methyltransferase n=1 Tax=Planktotalea sp. TaxID=2029877 RepID=UPI0001838A58|nr:class I SAM-dependent rRNA methyltransferase [Planktotalea sp.]EDZ40756.1 SAM-dependent methyltransferase [Rhodobacteraceae bacterium HTCC2083]MBT5821920.1 class I SAM-dependent rRNA methyltransferase [Paracoccaceae bacterium]MDG1075499.1 class I SAM-dependent rRNA methyltransferase [Planktotalea sp.]MDG1083069.1 class I SAM-dependent rRNA methyltransferase [Planktotalea sp.]HCW84808.1 class I SAM-dependent rRNA methyltransferase [Paracoccaceae bacterium]
MIASSFPVLRLKPKANARAIRHGAPWVYDNELVLDRRSKNLAPGTIAVLEDAERNPMGLVATNPLSRITARMIERDVSVAIDQAWFAAKIKRALELRERLFDHPFYRLIHAEADGLPGLVVDRFDSALVVQPNAAWLEVLIEPLATALAEVTGATTILKNAAGRTRVLEGLDDENGVLLGTAPNAPVMVPMNGAHYAADLTGGQKTGLFYDQRPNHAFAARLSEGADVLDVFSHVGGFGLAALAGGAKSALCVDGSAPALALAELGAKDAGFGDTMSTRKGDAFDVLEALGKDGAQYDVVICDPPAFAPGKAKLEVGLRAYERLAKMAAPLVKEGGYLVLCSCSHAADLGKFRFACTRGIGRADRAGSLIHTGFAGPDHPLMPQLAESGYLKALFYRL